MRDRYRQAIAAALEAWSGAPARWGRDDCALAIANIDRAVVGVDPARAWRGRYRTEKTAKKLMGKRGILGVAAAIARAMKWKRIDKAALSKARDGDRGVALTSAGASCVIRYCGFWVGRIDRGNVLASDTQIIKAWSVG